MIREVKTAAPPANRPQVKGNAATETPLPAGWKKRAWYPYPTITPAGRASLGGIASVVSDPWKVDILWIGPKGSIEGYFVGSSYLDRGTRYQVAGEGSATAGGSITALSWKSDHMGVFWVSPDVAVHQAVRGSSTDLTHPWEKFLVVPAKSAVPLSSLAACSLDVNHTEVY